VVEAVEVALATSGHAIVVSSGTLGTADCEIWATVYYC
jgi:hypothetical protein